MVWGIEQRGKMKKNKLGPLQRIGVTYFHRTRYQQSLERERSGEKHLCDHCQMLLAVRQNNIWHFFRNGLGVRVASPCARLESDCPGCGKTNVLEEYPQSHQYNRTLLI